MLPWTVPLAKPFSNTPALTGLWRLGGMARSFGSSRQRYWPNTLTNLRIIRRDGEKIASRAEIFTGEFQKMFSGAL